MEFKKTFGMQLTSFVTMLVLVAGAPMPAFVAYAEEAVTESPAAADTPAPAETSTPEPDPAPVADTPSSETPADTNTAQTTSETTEAGGDAEATGGEGGAGGEGGSGVNGGTGGEGAGGGEADATGGTTDATGGAGGDGGSGGDATDGGTAGEGGTGGSGGGADADSNTPAGEVTGADATGGSGGSGGDGGSGTGGATDAGAGGGGGSGGSADADANGDEAAADAIGGEGGSGGNGGDGGSVPTQSETQATSTGAVDTNEDKGAVIETGRANSFAYLFSLFNIAITNSSGNILFLRNPLNTALDFTQRIKDLFSGLTSTACDFLGCSNDDADFRLYTENEVDISNELVVSSLSGENRAYSTEGGADIATGDAGAYGGIVNFGNLQIVDSRYLILLMTNEGDLSGDILLPDGDFFKTLSAGAKIGGDSVLNVNNDAGILNNGTTTALTGDNTALSTEGSVIDTGNARAKTSVMNFANQIGAPICFVVNVAGTWNGEVSQMPEGFTHEKASFGHVICGAGGGEGSGGTSGFHASTTNYARVLNNAIVEAKTGGNTAEGASASITTGDADAFLSILNVVNQTIIGQDWIFAVFNVAGDWDGNLQFGPKPGQPDILGEITAQISGGGGGSGKNRSHGAGFYSSDIVLTKEAAVTKVSSPAQVEYTITVDNRGSKLKKVVVDDTMHGPDGKEIGSQRWNLGTMAANEIVTIKYTIDFKHDAEPGYYTNEAAVSGTFQTGIPLAILRAEDVVEILPGGEVLGMGPQCEPLITEYIRPGTKNTPAQVSLLQTFLNDSEGENLAVTGIYDAPTIAALNRFQKKYATDILSPWGISHATSNVYYTTQKKINALYCKDESGFELTTGQLLEISKFKAQLSKPNADFNTNDVGLQKLKPTAKGPFLMPPSAIPSIFAPVSNTKDAKPVSMMSLPTNLFKNWLLSAIPQVEALER